jgi:hypothetical protein
MAFASAATGWLFDIKVSEFYTGVATGVVRVAVTVMGAPLTAEA